MASNRMPSRLPKNAPGGEGLDSTRCAPGSEQRAFSFDAKTRIEQTQRDFAAMFGEAVKAFGGTAALVRHLDKPPSYETKINDAIAGRDERKVQGDWFAPLFDDPASGPVIAAWINQRTGHEPPVQSRVIDPAEVDRAAREVIAEMDEEHREIYRRKIARKCGVKPDAIKF